MNKQYCPYCGEPIELMIDSSVDEQQYTEDCFVCCRPMIVSVRFNPLAAEPDVVVSSEDDSIAF